MISEPTSAEPGSEEKLETLVERYAAGLPLWHPDDLNHLVDDVGSEPAGFVSLLLPEGQHVTVE